MNIDEIMISIGIDPKKAKQGMKDAVDTIKQGTESVVAETKAMATSIEAGLAGVTKIFTGFGGALIGAFSIGSAFSTWKEQATEFGNVARNLKMDIADVQGWVGAMGKFGGTSTDFESNLRGLNAQLAKMATVGSSRTGKLLESLGIDAGSIGRQRDALDVLEDIAGVIEGMSPDESRGVLQALGFDSSMIMLLQQGREGMKDLIRQKKEDAVYTKEDADAVKAYNVAMGGLKKGFMGIAGTLFRMIMPALTAVTKYIGQFVSFLRKHQTLIKVFFTMIAGLVTGLLIPAFVQFGKALLRNPFTWVILAIAGIALVIEDLIVWMEGGKSALDDFWTSLFGDRENAKKIFEDIKTKAMEMVNDIQSGFERLKKVLSNHQGFLKIVGGIGLAAGVIKTVLIPAIMGIGKAFSVLGKALMGNPITAAIMVIITLLLDLMSYAETGESTFDSLWNAIFGSPEEASQALAMVGEIVEGIGIIALAVAKWWIETWAEMAQRIVKLINDAIDWVQKKWDSLPPGVKSIIDTIAGFIEGLASTIRSAIGSAIDWALAKFRMLRDMASKFLHLDISASESSYGGGGGSYYEGNSSSANIGEINVYTQATDAQGIANDIGGATYGAFNPYNSQGGFRI